MIIPQWAEHVRAKANTNSVDADNNTENNNLEGNEEYLRNPRQFYSTSFTDVQLLRQTHSWCLRRRNIFAEPSKPSYSLLSC